MTLERATNNIRVTHPQWFINYSLGDFFDIGTLSFAAEVVTVPTMELSGKKDTAI